MKKLLILFFFLEINLTYPQNIWQQTEWSYGGKITSLAVNKDGVIFAGTCGGIYKSSDSGTTWNKITSDLTDLIVNCLAISPEDHLYAGTSHGIYVSKDQGLSWNQLFTSEQISASYRINSISFNSAGHIFCGTYGGVFYSSNKGESWARALYNYDTYLIYVGPNDYVFAACAFDYFWLSTNNGHGWSYDASTSPRDLLTMKANSIGTIFYGLSHGIGISEKNGSHYHVINGLNNKAVYSLAFNSADHIFAGTDSGVYISKDSGITWLNISNDLNIQVSSLSMAKNGFLYAATYEGAYRSTDDGMNWTTINYGLNNAVITAFATDKKGNVYVGTEGGGVYYSDDDGSTFQITGLKNIFVNSIAIADSQLFIGTKEGLYISSDRVNFLKRNLTTGIWKDVKSVAVDPYGNVYAVVNYDSIYSSSDRGLTWKNSGLSYYSSNLVSDNDGCIFAVGEFGILKIRYDNPEWRKLGNFRDCIIAIDSKNNIFSSTSDGIYYSSDHGNSWTKTGSLDNIKTLISENNYLFAGTTDGVHLSSNSGMTWKTYSDGLTRSDVKCFTINSYGYLFAGTNGAGIFRSKNPDVILPVDLQSLSYQIENDQVRLDWVTGSEKNNLGFEIEKKLNGSFEKAGFVKGKGTSSEINKYSFVDNLTENGKYIYRLRQLDFDGTFKYSNSLEVNYGWKPTFNLSVNFPNPFNSSTVISFDILQETFVSLKVFDILGREIETLVNEKKKPGKYRILFNANNLVTGIYLYKIQAGNFIKTQKMIYIK